MFLEQLNHFKKSRDEPLFDRFNRINILFISYLIILKNKFTFSFQSQNVNEQKT